MALFLRGRQRPAHQTLTLVPSPAGTDHDQPRQRNHQQHQRHDAAEHDAREAAPEFRTAGSDGVVQQLAAASFATAGQAERAAAAGEAKLAADLQTTAATIRDGIAGLRSLLVDIYPASLHDSGLEPALRDLARSASSTDASITVEADPEAAAALSPDTREATYRVAQEAVRNAIRHGRASRIGIRLSRADNDVQLMIEDDGVGFDAAAVAEAASDGHFGLRLMADAARRCGAGLAVSSKPGGGTRLRMRMASA